MTNVIAQPPSRRDMLPEYAHYKDTGCELYRSCLSCPLERCRYDQIGGERRILADERDLSIVAMRREGRPITRIADYLGISRRTVFQVLAEARQIEP